ncbi:MULTISPECIES: response regulator [unclassified Meridianimarinicoccus]|uniref:response regulator n=1 Tax=unclassified Meridianimarinicoccus TaxID=2923344 RepID=UPI001868E35A|nr:response regulator transcription factor [Fluviibacterium sp. MJW13]
MSQLIYILEDETEMARIMRRALEGVGYKTQHFRLRSDFEKALQKTAPDLMLIDLSLPDGDGLTMISDSVKRRGIPAIIVTGRGDSTDKIVGLELGADDYIVKPFEPREMVARVRAVLRRGQAQSAAKPQSHGPKVAEFDGWVADFSSCTLCDPDGNTENLSSAEAALLETFLTLSGRVLSRSKLLDIGSPDDLDPYDRSIDARISRLRRKLGDDPKSPKMIRTVYGAGYVFVTKVHWQNE